MKKVLSILALMLFAINASGQKHQCVFSDGSAMDIYSSCKSGDVDLIVLTFNDGKMPTKKVDLYFSKRNIDDLGALSDSIQKIAEKCMEWDSIAEANGISDMKKSIPTKLPLANAVWSGTADSSTYQCDAIYSRENGETKIVLFGAFFGRNNSYINTLATYTVPSAVDLLNLSMKLIKYNLKKLYNEDKAKSDLFQ